MTFLDAPAYDERRENLKKYTLIGIGTLLLLTVIIALAGIFTGHGWFFSNIPAEHKVDKFLTTIEKKDYPAAYGIYVNDKNWQQHADKYSGYPLPRFIEDWTLYSPIKGEITSHHVDKSIVDGSGPFGTSILVGVTVNGDKRIFIQYIRSDGSLTCCMTSHIFKY